MAQLGSSQIQRVFVEGAGSRFAIFRVSEATTDDTVDLSTTFQFCQGGMGIQAGIFANLASSVTASGTTITFAPMTGLSTSMVWLGVLGVAAP